MMMVTTEVDLIKNLERIAKALEKLVEQNEKALNDIEKKKTKQFQEQEQELRNLMKDPRYWKHQDPEMVKRVEEGFKRLYG
jgi:DNA anti-recombination protein RmuC